MSRLNVSGVVEIVIVDGLVEFTAPDDNMWQWILYAILGAGIVVANLPVVLLYAAYPTFREKDYLLVIALAFGDTLGGLAYCVAGVKRTALMLLDRHNDKVSSLDCLLTVSNMLWVALSVDLFVALIMLSTSLDRLLLVRFPLQYIHFGEKYVWGMIGISATCALCAGMAGAIPTIVQPSAPVYPAICYFSYAAAGTNWAGNQYLMCTVIITTSVCVYLLVILVGRGYYGRTMASLKPGDTRHRMQLRAQRRMTISLGLSNLTTFLLVVVPYAVVTSLTFLNVIPGKLTVTMWIVTLVNPMLNIVIYYTRHWEVRRALAAMLRCKHLPLDTALWGTSTAKG